MQPKAYVPGVAVLLTALLAGCTGSDESSSPDDKPGTSSTTAPAAPPGRYRTLPEPCGVVSKGALDALLPGIKQLTDEEQRETAYEGEATQTFDTDRRVGCRWKVASTVATDHLFLDFERVVSYDSAVSDDDKAAEVYAAKLEAADLPEPSAAESDGGDSKKDGKKADGEGVNEDETGAGASGDPKPSESATESASDSSSSPDSPGSSDSADSSGSPDSADSSASPSGTPAALQPRTLDDLSDEAFLNDELSTAQQRTVTVVFRTSNVIVTVEYAEQPTSVTEVPDSKEMQDRARNLAARLAESFND
ncbi:DUF3558 domain-containing protein [Streptomyces sp. KM273126]|uniref:DUF3558 domain-containing protein n=1 Tax=Streptomyces sp. KM273126 TaxID=2545247 RepID=UPI0010405702|nr:DUF3558 domain-containing protein [Streptomyces sp. KM273126]MBA2808162.1 DUF3558 domain-containing protein [Streptomyces sp. KM273126]